ncbi:MAG: ATP-binding protein [Desulfocapsaceae bacterium]|nr:ATP-binding protein [Desulfocapsaceae bacterium]
MKSTLSIKIIVRLTAVIVLCAFFIGLFQYFQTRAEIQQDLDSTLGQVSKRLSNSLVMPVWNLDNEVVDGIVTTEMLDKRIYAVVVKDELSGSYMAAKTRNKNWEIINATHPENLQSSMSKVLPINLNDRHLGDVFIYLTDAFQYDQLMDELSKMISRMFIMLLLVIAFLIFSINLIVTRPLNNFSRVCRKIAEGNFSLVLDTERSDEIGSLARSFSQMRNAVREKITILNDEIKERKRSETELRRLRTYLSNIVDSMPSIIISIDNDFRVTQWNIEAEKISGVQKEKAQGRILLDVIPSLSSIHNSVKQALEDNQVKTKVKAALEINEETRLFDIAIYPLIANGTEGTVIRLDDVTDRVKLEEVMVQTEKMMFVGGLAAGMAHEINNPLAGMMQGVQVIQNRFSPDFEKNHQVAEQCSFSLESLGCYLQEREISPMLESILDSGERAARIINNMLSFSRKSTSRYTPCDLAVLLDQTVELASNDYDLKKKFDFRKIEIIREYDTDISLVRCDSGTVQQVFLNILKNAAQAISAAGEKYSADIKPEIILRLFESDGDMYINIEDNGIGMDEETRKRIFEPFYTTKTVGVGTGLGLSVSYFIIKENHKGTIQVSSAPGKGSNFIISLPLE